MIDTLVYTFSKKFSSFENLHRIVELYTETYESNKNIYSIKFYTDNQSVSLFEKKIDNIKIVDTSHHVLLDDLKLSVMESLSENELIFDGDIFLEHSLSIPTDNDVICERITFFDNFPQARQKYKNAADLYISNGVQTVIPFFNNYQPWSPNIGMLYFYNKDAQKKYLEYYYILREWFIDNDIEGKYGLMRKDIRNYATIGQYILGLVCENFNYSIDEFRKNNSYTHLDGPIKYAENLNYQFFKNKVK